MIIIGNLLTMLSYANRETTQANITGIVICNGEEVPYINVFIKGTTIGTTTDETGRYELVNLPEGTHTIVVQGLGYKKAETQIEAKSYATRELRFTLVEDVLNLEGVVVTADRHGTSRVEAPVIVNTLTAERFESTQSVNIATGLDFVPGLRLENNCSNCGFSQVRMNGMEGPYSQILINSRPVFSGLAGVYGLELIPANMVDRIEVVRGGGSALFGGNAIAGTINVITRTPTSNTFGVEARYGAIGIGSRAETAPAADRTINLNGSVVTDDLKSGITFFGMLRERDPYDQTGDGFSEMVSMNNTTLGVNGFHKFSARGRLSLDLYRIDEFRRGGNMFDYLPHEADITEQVRHKITGTNLALDLFTGKDNLNKLMVYTAAQWVDRDSYYGAGQDPDAYGHTHDATFSVGAQYHMSFSERSSLIAGIDNNHSRMEDTKLGANGNPNTTITHQYINTVGSFGQWEWRSGIFKASAGLRFDSYLIRDLGHDGSDVRNDNIRGNVLAPRLNLLFDVSPTLQLRTAYSQGYRAPQVFDEDLHIESSGSRRIMHINSTDLQQESSHAFTASMRYIKEFGPVLTEFVAEGFYTRLIDPFAYEYTFVDSTKTLLLTRENASEGAFVAGVNFEFNAAFPGDISLQAGLTVQTSKYDNPQPWGEGANDVTDNFLRTPGSYGYLTLDWQPFKRLSAAFTLNYTGRMFVPHYGLEAISPEEQNLIEEGRWDAIAGSRQDEITALVNGDVISGERLEHTERFLAVGLRLGYDIPVSKLSNLQVWAGVQNIFNQTQQEFDNGIFRDAGYIYGPGQPRTINVGIKFENIW
jgi:outer membrane receptor for ferrienterochelin and colicins